MAVKRTSECSYGDRIKEILEGNGKITMLVGSETRHPQIEVEYTDYKPANEVRRMLEEAMPHVYFSKIERLYSNDALVTCLMSRDETFDDDDIRIITTDNRILSLLDYMWDQAYERDFTDLSWQRERYHLVNESPSPSPDKPSGKS